MDSITAIWKKINDLRKMGYEIDSVTNRGYKLMSSPGILNEGETKTYIDDNFSLCYYIVYMIIL